MATDDTEMRNEPRRPLPGILDAIDFFADEALGGVEYGGAHLIVAHARDHAGGDGIDH